MKYELKDKKKKKKPSKVVASSEQKKKGEPINAKDLNNTISRLLRVKP